MVTTLPQDSTMVCDLSMHAQWLDTCPPKKESRKDAENQKRYNNFEIVYVLYVIKLNCCCC